MLRRQGIIRSKQKLRVGRTLVGDPCGWHFSPDGSAVGSCPVISLSSSILLLHFREPIFLHRWPALFFAPLFPLKQSGRKYRFNYSILLNSTFRDRTFVPFPLAWWPFPSSFLRAVAQPGYPPPLIRDSICAIISFLLLFPFFLFFTFFPPFTPFLSLTQEQSVINPWMPGLLEPRMADHYRWTADFYADSRRTRTSFNVFTILMEILGIFCTLFRATCASTFAIDRRSSYSDEGFSEKILFSIFSIVLLFFNSQFRDQKDQIQTNKFFLLNRNIYNRFFSIIFLQIYVFFACCYFIYFARSIFGYTHAFCNERICWL